MPAERAESVVRTAIGGRCARSYAGSGGWRGSPDCLAAESGCGGSGLLASMGVLLKIGLSAADPPLDCLSGSFPASLLMVIYMVLMVILLVNMLIAMM